MASQMLPFARSSRRPCACSKPARCVRAKVVSGQYNHVVPNFDYIERVLDEFPEGAVANPDEARALYTHGGYTMLDIRNPVEVDRYGKVPTEKRGGRSVCIPYQLAHKRFEDSEVRVNVEDNPEFLDEVAYHFDKDAKLLVMDFDGQTCAMDALDELYEEGYENIVGVQGGYKNWFKTWDNKLKRRNLGEYQEHSWGQGDSSCGIHASGAGFENQDAQSADFWNSF